MTHSNDTASESSLSSASIDSTFKEADFDDLLKMYGEGIEKSDILPYRRDVRIAINTAFFVLIVISLFGNTLVCLVMMRSSQVRSVTNFFLANQAFSDILMTLFNIPLVLTRDLSDDWPYGRWMCYLTDYIIQVSIFVSSFTLTVIAIDRHQVIVHPLRPRMDIMSACLISFIIWALSLILSLPSAMFRKLHRWETTLQSGYKCIASYPEPSDFYRKLFVIISITLRYVIPMIIIIIAYCLIAATLRARTTVGYVTALQRDAKDRSKRRTSTMLILVVSIFAVCWFPLNCYTILVLYFEPFHSNVLHLVLYYFAMISVCLNPFVYSWRNAKFRAEIYSIYSILCIKERDRAAELKSTIKDRGIMEIKERERSETDTKHSSDK
ncbi:probable G-protein coupled receptor 83 isoform X2 [Anneissia japonica]|nr:probable G-protein coupled receptor 83 isoform X2 [Anneissia japonica]